MMFSERLEYGKYDFQHLQGAAWAQKITAKTRFLEDFQWFSSVGLFGTNNRPHFSAGPPNFKNKNLRRYWSKIFLVKNIIKVCTWTFRKNWESRKNSFKKWFKLKISVFVSDFVRKTVCTYLERLRWWLWKSWSCSPRRNWLTSLSNRYRWENHHYWKGRRSKWVFSNSRLLLWKMM